MSDQKNRIARILLITGALPVLLIPIVAQQTGILQKPVGIGTGLISGVSTAAPGVRAFKGLPYAAPPVGDLRWRPPQPPAKWEGVRKADRFSDSCVQNLARSAIRGRRNLWCRTKPAKTASA